MKKWGTLCEALAIGPKAPAVISLVGGGGKTTAMFRLAHELKARGGKVLITTSTNIFVPEPWQCDEFMLEGCPDMHALAERPAGTITCLGNGVIEGTHRKVQSIDPAFIDDLGRAGYFDCILVEADGAKRKPLKAPADYEPVIPASTGLTIGVIGLDALGHHIAEDTIHRCELFCALTGTTPGGLIDVDCIVKVITADNGLFKNVPAGCRTAVLLNKADTAAVISRGGQIAQELATQKPEAGCIIASLQQEIFFTAPFA